MGDNCIQILAGKPTETNIKDKEVHDRIFKMDFKETVWKSVC
jgi:hypothetical protein